MSPGPRGALTAAERYADATRNMRASQLAARPKRLVPPVVMAAGRPARRATFAPVASGAGLDPAPQSGPQPPPHHDRRFRAVGVERPFDDERFWADPSCGLLFLFHLHGFADLAAYSAAERTDAGDAFWATVLRSWLERCGRPARPAWHPYPTSGRVIAWCAALSRGGWDRALAAAMARSLARQLRLLRRSVEHDIGGNHVLRNAAALVIGGLCTGDRRAERGGLALLERELERQVLADGGHEERSPSYQRVVLADLEDVRRALEAASRPVPPGLDTTAARMRGWLRALAGPDGALPLLNDAWEGPPVEPMPGAAVTDLAATGYVVLRHGGDQAVLDVGEMAPRHLPPHAHADVLSFVLWADGAPLVVDPGTFTYGGPERQRFRGTAAHGTVEVDGRDQCDLWRPFRAAFMPRVERLELSDGEDAVVLRARHDGYARLPDPVTHERTFCWLRGDGIVVVDRVLGRRAHGVTTRLPLAPGIGLERGMAGPLEVHPLGSGPAPVVEAGSYSPFLGRREPIQVVRRDLEPAPGAAFGWALARPGVGMELDGPRLTVRRPGRPQVVLRVG